MKKIILVLVCLSLHIFFSYPLKADQPKALLQEANRYVFQAVNLSDKIEAIYLYGITHFPSDKTYVIGLEQSLADFYIEYKYYFEYDTGKGGVVSNPSPNPTAFTTSETCNTSGYFSGPAGEGWIRVTTTAQQDPDCCEEIQVQRVDTSSFVWEAILFKIVYDILPVKDWSPDEVKLNILDSSNDVVFSTNLTNSPGNNKTYLWNGKDNTGALVIYGNYKVKIKVKEGSLTMETE